MSEGDEREGEKGSRFPGFSGRLDGTRRRGLNTRVVGEGRWRYFMNALHINCRSSLRNWKKARDPW